VSQGGADGGGRPAGGKRWPSKGGLARKRESSCQSPPISAALRKFVPFDELLQRLHCLVEELEIPEE
jgi:hypothetical protein